MVAVPVLSEATRTEIAARLGPLIEGLDAVRALDGGASLGESIPMALLRQDMIEDDDGGLAGRLQDMARWHHQIYVGDSAPAYARSVAGEGSPDPTEIAEVGTSTLPHAVRVAMGWIDGHIDAEGEARLIMVPSHQVVALWLNGPDLDRVVVVTAPAGIEALAPLRATSADAFLNTLRGMPPIIGVEAERQTEGGDQ